jgi:hypothetical protein
MSEVGFLLNAVVSHKPMGRDLSAFTTARRRISDAEPAQKRNQRAVVLEPQAGCRQALEEHQKTSELV